MQGFNEQSLSPWAFSSHVLHNALPSVPLHAGIFRDNEAREERIMDSDPLEKQRGITILAKNTAIQYMDTKVRHKFCMALPKPLQPYIRMAGLCSINPAAPCRHCAPADYGSGDGHSVFPCRLMSLTLRAMRILGER